MVKIYLVKCNGFTYVDSTDEDEFIITNRVMKYLAEKHPVEYELLDEVTINDAEAREYFWIMRYYRKVNNLNENRLGNHATEKLLNVVGDVKDTKIIQFDLYNNLISVYPSITDFCYEYNMDRGYVTKLVDGEKSASGLKLIRYNDIINSDIKKIRSMLVQRTTRKERVFFEDKKNFLVEEYKKNMEDLGWNIDEKEYVDASKKIKHTCNKCGNIRWYSPAEQNQQKRKCYCSGGKYTKEEKEKKAKEYCKENNLIYLGQLEKEGYYYQYIVKCKKHKNKGMLGWETIAQGNKYCCEYCLLENKLKELNQSIYKIIDENKVIVQCNHCKSFYDAIRKNKYYWQIKKCNSCQYYDIINNYDHIFLKREKNYIYYKCPKTNNIYKKRIETLKNKGLRCSDCRTITRLKRAKEINKDVKKVIGSKAECYCSIHGDYDLYYNNIIHHKQQCPKCTTNISFGEKYIMNYLDLLNIFYEQQKSFNDLKYKGLLRYDFYIPSFNLCIEYNGEQHYRPVEYFGGEEALKTQKERDVLKKQYCEENNIDLLVIKYNDNILEILNNFFSSNIKNKDVEKKMFDKTVFYPEKKIKPIIKIKQKYLLIDENENIIKYNTLQECVNDKKVKCSVSKLSTSLGKRVVDKKYLFFKEYDWIRLNKEEKKDKIKEIKKEKEIEKIKVHKNKKEKKKRILPKKIIAKNIETGETTVYNSLHEAQRKGFDRHCIRKCCQGKQKIHKGFEWKFA